MGGALKQKGGSGPHALHLAQLDTVAAAAAARHRRGLVKRGWRRGGAWLLRGVCFVQESLELEVGGGGASAARCRQRRTTRKAAPAASASAAATPTQIPGTAPGGGCKQDN